MQGQVAHSIGSRERAMMSSTFLMSWRIFVVLRAERAHVDVGVLGDLLIGIAHAIEVVSGKVPRVSGSASSQSGSSPST